MWWYRFWGSYPRVWQIKQGETPDYSQRPATITVDLNGVHVARYINPYRYHTDNDGILRSYHDVEYPANSTQARINTTLFNVNAQEDAADPTLLQNRDTLTTSELTLTDAPDSQYIQYQITDPVKDPRYKRPLRYELHEELQRMDRHRRFLAEKYGITTRKVATALGISTVFAGAALLTEAAAAYLGAPPASQLLRQVEIEPSTMLALITDMIHSSPQEIARLGGALSIAGGGIIRLAKPPKETKP